MTSLGRGMQSLNPLAYAGSPERCLGGAVLDLHGRKHSRRLQI